MGKKEVVSYKTILPLSGTLKKVHLKNVHYICIWLILVLSWAKISPLQRLDMKHCKSKAVFSINGQPRGMP